MKTTLKILITGFIALLSMTACIDSDWDLDTIDTSNNVVADTIVAPLGSVYIDIDHMLEKAGVPPLEIDSIEFDIVFDETFSYDNSSLNYSIADILTGTDGNVSIRTTIENNTNANFDIQTSYVSDSDETIALPNNSAAAKETTSFELNLTTEELESIINADRLDIRIARSDTGEAIVIKKSDNIKVSFVILKTGGINL